ncbi:flexirubin biosynthesis protein [Leadbetterella byssophila]|jgi:3-hydroxyacyl-[acyl-carrier-protein] dehydratase|uniref:Flexirubin-type pigment biosynthesis acyl carrier protein DarC1 n=1 Tax=Leadbetterella byssophila (strain DSM 17132 / JCM 16389 / KACC 11308 / NBRC 106382 / 4M15) TaxID=649349 RepID=E4RXI4_LEAB4|nr:flexirubin biosynthesis protein [Leadbetterella byssophila]ADQ17219.1 flexirubin-type pigment biosynthesis acyl carrier protein DarC1 [Leadbetterella byssophila DSM 17132]
MIDIHQFLPHTAPMLAIDAITQIDDAEVICVYEVPKDSVFVENSSFLEAGLVENAAQSASCIVAQSYSLEGKSVIGFISSIRSVHIYELPKVGDLLRTEARLISRYDAENYSTCRVECKTFRGDLLLLEGEINLFIQEHEKGRSTTG